MFYDVEKNKSLGLLISIIV